MDCFLISALIGSLIALYLKNYLSEKTAVERLKNSIINKSTLVASRKPIFNSKKAKIKKIYRFTLRSRGGQLEEFQADFEFSNEIFKLAQGIQQMVERLAVFLKQRELKGILRIFFTSGRLILELVLYRGAAGFTLSWVSVGPSLVTPLYSSFRLKRIHSHRIHSNHAIHYL